MTQFEGCDAASRLQAMPRQRAFIGMGGNLGDVAAFFQSALAGMHALPATRVEAMSPLYRTRPVDATGPDYLNAVAVLQSALGPHELLRALQRLEWAHDRERPYLNAPRTLDLDLLAYGGYTCQTPTLSLPHPRMAQRAFVLAPLADVMAQLDGGWMPELPHETVRAELARKQGIERIGPDLVKKLEY